MGVYGKWLTIATIRCCVSVYRKLAVVYVVNDTFTYRVVQDSKVNFFYFYLQSQCTINYCVLHFYAKSK